MEDPESSPRTWGYRHTHSPIGSNLIGRFRDLFAENRLLDLVVTNLGDFIGLGPDVELIVDLVVACRESCGILKTRLVADKVLGGQE